MYPPQPLDVGATTQATAALKSLVEWTKKLSSTEVTNNRYNAALDSINQAILETRKYQKRLRDGQQRDAQTEDTLSGVSSNVAAVIQPYNAEMSHLCRVKGHGWADATVWDKPEYKDLAIDLEQMLSHLRELANRPPPAAIPSWFPIAAVIFTLLTLASLFYLIVRPEDIGPGKRIIFDVWVAFCLAASLSFIGGSAQAQGRLPWLGKSPIKFLAYGGVGVFIVALLILATVYR